ncbi:MAG: hypothetical protein WDN76_05990 [Alphaproteobacteria bacterium]
MPEMLVNITSGDGRPVYLKLKLTLEAPDEGRRRRDRAANCRASPISSRRSSANCAWMIFPAQPAHSACVWNCSGRVNLAMAPAQVNAVLIEEMLVQ